MISQVVIVAGGSPELWPDLTPYKQAETVWIGVDRGSFNLLEIGIVPNSAVGDFDSLTKVELTQVEQQVGDMHYSNPEKDNTDTQLAIELALAKYPNAAIILIGATGGRLDHFLANLWMPLEPRFKQELGRITLVDRQNTITYFMPGDYVITKEADKDYLAYICLTSVEKLTLYNAKYQLTEYNATMPMSFASNEFLGDTSHFSFESGVLAVIQSKD